MVSLVEDFDRLCLRYERLHGREPLHARAAREALQTDESPVSQIRHVRVAAEGTLKFVLRERGGEELYQRVSAKHPTLKVLITEFEKNPTLRNQLRDIDGWARVEQDFKHIQHVGNRASHHQKGTVHDSLQPGVYESLKRVLAWAWGEARLDVGTLETPQWGYSASGQGHGQDRATPQTSVEPKVIQPQTKPSKTSHRPVRRLQQVLGVLALLVVLCMGAVLVWEVFGLDAEQLLGDAPAMNPDAPTATRALPNRRADQPKR